MISWGRSSVESAVEQWELLLLLLDKGGLIGILPLVRLRSMYAARSSEESVVFAVFKGFEFSSGFCVTFSLSPRSLYWLAISMIWARVLESEESNLTMLIVSTFRAIAISNPRMKVYICALNLYLIFNCSIVSLNHWISSSSNFVLFF